MLYKLGKWFIVIGTTLSLGFLALAGTLLLNPTWFGVAPLVWGILAFMLSVVIEGLVYNQNISRALEKSSNSGKDYLKKAITRAVIDKRVALDPKSSGSLAEKYHNAKQLLEILNHIEDELAPIDWILSPRKRWKLHQKKEDVAREVERLAGELKTFYNIDDAQIDQLTKKKLSESLNLDLNRIIAREIQARHSLKGVIAIQILSFLTGGSILFAAFKATQLGIAALGILAGTPASWVICLAVALFASIGTNRLTYNNLIEVLHKKTSSLSSNSLSLKKVICYGLLFLLSGFIAAATAWTYLSSGIEIGNELLKFGALGTPLFMGIWAVGAVVSLFIWNATNLSRTVELIRDKALGKIKSTCRNLSEQVKNAWEKTKEQGNYHHFFNPLRWIEAPFNFLFRAFVLIAHGVSDGVGADNLDRVPPLATTLINGTGNSLMEAHYLSHDHGHHEHHEEDEDAFEPPNIAFLNEDERESDPYQIEELPEGDHSHFDLAGVLLIFILLPLKIARFTIDVVFTFVGKLCCVLKESIWDSICHSFEEIFSPNPLLEIQDLNNPGAISLPSSRFDQHTLLLPAWESPQLELAETYQAGGYFERNDRSYSRFY